MATTQKMPTTERTTPAKARAFHPPSAQVYAHQENHPDRASQPSTMSNSTPEVANPHQPRTVSSNTRAVNPAEDATNPESEGTSMCRAAGRGCSMLYAIGVVYDPC